MGLWNHRFYFYTYFRDSEHFAGVLAFVFIVSFFWVGDRIFKFKFKYYHYVALIFMALFGVLFSPLYLLFPGYDKVLHFTFPFLGCFLIFYIVNKLELDLRTKLMFSFSIMITLITFSEIAEFILDWLFDLNLQGVFAGDVGGTFKIASGDVQVLQSRISDTMTDLILGVLGSATFVLVKLRGK
ncbi:hypothetical protein HOD75_01365 [archaeon]|nr:hypothetical protein [archaeon]MBT4241527.1 hypothetical protein [archaeon]MBT4417602.1 hypothetical protein [archaeon]